MKLFGILLTPSWLSGLMTVVAALTVVLGSIVLLHYNDSSWQLVLAPRQQNTSPLVATGIYIPDSPASTNVLIDNIPLLVFWAGVGVIIYSFAMAIFNTFITIASLRQEMNYVHVDRRQLVLQAAGRLLFRSLVLLVWVLYIGYSLHLFLPHIVSLASAGGDELRWWYDAGYILAAVGLAALCLHLHTILLRLLFLKPRLFSPVIQA